MARWPCHGLRWEFEGRNRRDPKNRILQVIAIQRELCCPRRRTYHISLLHREVEHSSTHMWQRYCFVVLIIVDIACGWRHSQFRRYGTSNPQRQPRRESVLIVRNPHTHGKIGFKRDTGSSYCNIDQLKARLTPKKYWVNTRHNRRNRRPALWRRICYSLPGCL